MTAGGYDFVGARSEIDVGRLIGAWEAMLESQMVGGLHRFWHLA